MTVAIKQKRSPKHEVIIYPKSQQSDLHRKNFQLLPYARIACSEIVFYLVVSTLNLSHNLKHKIMLSKAFPRRNMNLRQ